MLPEFVYGILIAERLDGRRDGTMFRKAVLSVDLKRVALLALLATILLTLPAACTTNSPESTVNWVYSYDEALNLAQSDNRPVMIDFYADWCPPCKQMDATTYADDEVGAFLNENFVSLKVNVDRSNLHETYDITVIPTLVFLSPEETEIGIDSRIVGARSPQVFLELVEAVLNEWKQQA